MSEVSSEAVPFARFYGQASEFLWVSDSGEIHSTHQRGVSTPERTDAVYALLQNAPWHHVGIRVHQGKTKVWNSPGEKPPICETLERIARAADPRASVVEFGAALEFCHRHDASMRAQPQDVRDTVSMPLALGGLGLRSAVRGSMLAFLASWADCTMIRGSSPIWANFGQSVFGHRVLPANFGQSFFLAKIGV